MFLQGSFSIVALIWSSSPKYSRISSSVLKPERTDKHRDRDLPVLSIRHKHIVWVILLFEPCAPVRITVELKSPCRSYHTHFIIDTGERTNWETITRSAPLITNVLLSVIRGNLHKDF